MKEKLNTQKGITLIALIISIIVMLILALVSINIIMNQGLITKSKTAADTHQIAAEKEAINIGYSEYLTKKYNGKTNPTLTVADANVQENANEWTITFNAEPRNVYKLSKNGGIEGPTTSGNTGGAEGTEVDMEVALQRFTANPQNYVHPEQSSTNGNRAIGTDGQAVNMDLWDYIIKNEDNKEIKLAKKNGYMEVAGYSNSNIIDGKIKGTVPQYIYLEEKDKIYTVTDMSKTFDGCRSLTQAPTIPSSVTSMSSTFYGCTSLTQAPAIPNGVTNMNGTFQSCTSLTQISAIPSSITDMSYTFYGCTSLTQAPEIPNGVMNMDKTFYDCTSLTQAPEIPKSVTNMKETFIDCTSLAQAPEIPSSVTNMQSTFAGCSSLTQAPAIPSSVTNVVGTFARCTSLIQAPEIPSSVTSMQSTFYGCTSLTQAPAIPSSITDMSYTFYGCTSLTGTVRINSSNVEYLEYGSYCFHNITNNIKIQVPANSTTYDAFNTEYGSSSNITIETF